jgi:FixJ family two-component response regulator
MKRRLSNACCSWQVRGIAQVRMPRIDFEHGAGIGSCAVRVFRIAALVGEIRPASHAKGPTLNAGSHGNFWKNSMLPGDDLIRPAAVVFIVDDDASVRDALSSLLRSVGWQVRAFACASEFLASPRPALPACLVLDVSLPGENGLELHRNLSKMGDRTPVIFITGHGDIPMSVRAMKAGAVEFLPKPFREEDLLDAIELALHIDAAQLRAHTRLEDLRRRVGSLSPRELAVMRRVVRGMLNKHIAAELKIAEVTVKVHRRRVMEKTGAQSLAELVRLAELVEPSLT